MITFEQFILLFNNLSKLFYHELNGTAKKQRMYCFSYTDHEFDIVSTYLNEDIKRSNIKEKYLIPINQNTNMILFVVDEVETMNSLHHPYHIERSIFENGTATLTIAVTTAIKDNDAYVLYYLYSGIIRAMMELTSPIHDKFIHHPYENKLESASTVFPALLASTIIDFNDEYPEYESVIKRILEFAKSNCDYIQLLPDQELMNYIDSILV